MDSRQPDTSLDALLDDALADFDKQPDATVPSAAKAAYPEAQEMIAPEVQPGASSGSSNVPPPTDVFSQFFDKEMTEKLQVEWESAMKELLEDDPGLASQIKNLPTRPDISEGEGLPSEAASASTDTSQRTEPLSMEDAVKATITGMKQSTDELRNMTSATAEEKLLQDMKNMGLGGMGDMMGQMGLGDMGEGFESGFIEMMEGMMKNLLSKDILYPTMKHISGVYPDWLETNKGKISEGDFDRFKRQSVVMVKICENFESEEETDPDEVKKERLNDLMNLVEEMQECGNPPPELLDGFGSPVDAAKIFGGGAGVGGPPINPNDLNPDNCAVM